MALRLTVDIFSGRPNPSILLDDADAAAREIRARLKPRKRIRARVAVPPLLGYRGVLVEETDEEPQRLAAGRVLGHKGVGYVPRDERVEGFLFGSDGPLRHHLPVPLLERIRAESEKLHAGFPSFPELRPPVKRVCACAPIYEPTWWNDGGTRQFSNNCYNYASNYRTDTFAQPGLGSGAMYGAITGPEVLAAAIRDDLIDSPRANNKCPKHGHLVALVVGPHIDFHWYRKGPNGRWTHKPGGTEATDRDNSGNLISDPRTADRGFYTEFVGFLTVMHGHIKVR